MSIRILRACSKALALGGVLAGMAAGTSAPPVSVLRIEIENYVPYHYEVFDPTKFASGTDLTTAPPAVPFGEFVMIGDIVAVNGKPVKGAFALRATNLNLTPTVGVQPPNQPPQGRQAIGDVQRGNLVTIIWDMLDSDSNPIGTITATGLTRGPRAPGAPIDVLQDTLTITGGTGAFFGIRGQAGIIDMGSPRQATVFEAPANRRILGGARRSYLLQIIPLTTPEVAMTSSGPAVVHATDSTLVSTARPAKAGEIVTIYGLGLGPTRGAVPFGTVFPQPASLVAAPVEVLVNGSPAEVLYAGGYPGSADGYQINVRLPASLPAGTVELKIRSAWIEGSAVLIPIG
ncbi:MAG: hypothetical protein HY235_01445 [Acidobacteria bacterium]|nr:hypothetical protein [Acidobacteriota bacterium]